jgi:hypothetical protein
MEGNSRFGPASASCSNAVHGELREEKERSGRV